MYKNYNNTVTYTLTKTYTLYSVHYAEVYTTYVYEYFLSEIMKQ